MDQTAVLAQNGNDDVGLLRMQSELTIPTCQAAGQVTLQRLKGRIVIRSLAV